jgi:predicted nucleic acid-binding protein
MSVIDTNVLVHSSAAGSPEHVRARAALARLGTGEPVAVTRQVLREYLAATTRPQP